MIYGSAFHSITAVNQLTPKDGDLFQSIYYETCLHEEDSRSREKYLKSGMGKRYLSNRLKRFLSLTG